MTSQKVDKEEAIIHCYPPEYMENASFLRFGGGMRRDQNFLCVTTAGIQLVCEEGGCTVSILASLILEEESKK